MIGQRTERGSIWKASPTSRSSCRNRVQLTRTTNGRGERNRSIASVLDAGVSSRMSTSTSCGSGRRTRPFTRLLADLEAEGAEGMAATMVDMYANRPIAEHVSSGRRLIDDFPLFDDPGKGPTRLSATNVEAKFSQEIRDAGHDRHWRECGIASSSSRRASHNVLGNRLLRNSIRKSRTPKGPAYVRERILATITHKWQRRPPLNLTKAPSFALACRHEVQWRCPSCIPPDSAFIGTWRPDRTLRSPGVPKGYVISWKGDNTHFRQIIIALCQNTVISILCIQELHLILAHQVSEFFFCVTGEPTFPK